MLLTLGVTASNIEDDRRSPSLSAKLDLAETPLRLSFYDEVPGNFITCNRAPVIYAAGQWSSRPRGATARRQSRGFNRRLRSGAAERRGSPDRLPGARPKHARTTEID